MTATSPRAGRLADRLGATFYTVVAATALAGQAGAAVAWLHWPLLFAVPAVAALELGGIALAARADFRRRLGETALAARVLSAAVAVFAVAFNWLGHTDHRAGGFFAGMSALGYGVWLIQAGDRRRDQLRAEGKLPPTPPVYGYAQWTAHPWVTRRARALALADPTLGLYGSLAAATSAIRAERRQAALSKRLRERVAAAAGDRLTAEIAVTVYDLDEIAARLAASADYDRLTALVAAELDPARLGRVAATRVPANAATANRAKDMPMAALQAVAGGSPTRTAQVRSPNRTDAQLRRLLANPNRVPRDPDGSVPVRRAANLIGCGADRARRLLAEAGLLRIPEVEHSPVNGHRVPELVAAIAS